MGLSSPCVRFEERAVLDALAALGFPSQPRTWRLRPVVMRPGDTGESANIGLRLDLDVWNMVRRCSKEKVTRCSQRLAHLELPHARATIVILKIACCYHYSSGGPSVSPD